MYHISVNHISSYIDSLYCIVATPCIVVTLCIISLQGQADNTDHAEQRSLKNTGQEKRESECRE